MINLTELLDRAKKKALEKPDTKDGYAPKSTDELRFKQKHVVQKTDDRNGNKDDVFKATNVKTIERSPDHGYNPDEDEKVYEDYQEYSPFDPENEYKPSGPSETKSNKSKRIDDMMNKLGKQYGHKNLASKIKKRYAATNEEIEEVNEDSHASHFRFLRHLQKAGVSAPSKADAMDMIAKHGDPDRAGQAYVKRIKMIKTAANKVQKEEHNPELDKLVNKYSDHIVKSRDSQYPEAHEDEARYILTRIQKNHGKEAVRYARLHAQTNLNNVNRQENEKSKAELKKYYKPTSGPAYKHNKESVEQIYEARRKKSPTEKLFNRLKNYGIKDPSAKPLVGNQHKIDANKNGKIDAEDFKMLRKEEVQVDEVLKPSMGAGAYISDFVHSKNPKFAGKSKKERMKQALAAYYSAKRGE